MQNTSQNQCKTRDSDAGRRGESGHGQGTAASVLQIAVALGALVATSCSNAPGREAAGSASSASSVNVVLDLGDQARAAGDYPGAISFYRRALDLNPQQPRALSGLGYSLLDAGAPNEAAETFQKILAQSPNDAAAQVGLGEALLALDQPLAAATHLRKGLGSVGDARGFRALGVADDLLGQFQDAVADCERGLAATPNDPALRDDLGLSQILAGDVDGGLANLRAVASMPGAQARYRQNLALGLGLAGRAEEAERVARIDLDERSVASNLAYYATLRSLPPKDRAEAMLRPDRPPLAQTAIVK